MLTGHFTDFTQILRQLLTVAAFVLSSSALAATDENGQPLPDSSTQNAAGTSVTTEAATGAADNAEPAATEEEKSPPPPARVLPDEEFQRHKSVMVFLDQNNRADELVELVAGETRFYGLLLNESAGTPQGGVLILHDTEQHGQWPEIVAPLREQLPTWGWTTLAIELPDPPPVPVPARPVYQDAGTAESEAENTTDENGIALTPEEKAAEAPAEDASDSAGPALATDTSTVADTQVADAEPPLPRLEKLPPLPQQEQSTATLPPPGPDKNEVFRGQMLERIQSAVGYLNQHGQLNIVIIATGSSAPWAAAWMQQRPATVISTSQGKDKSRGYALVLIDAGDSRLNPVPLTQRLADLDMPVLDLLSEQNTADRWQSERRAGEMRHRQRKEYLQIEVPEFALQFDDYNGVIRRVRGWLKTNAAGTELPAG